VDFARRLFVALFFFAVALFAVFLVEGARFAAVVFFGVAFFRPVARFAAVFFFGAAFFRPVARFAAVFFFGVTFFRPVARFVATFFLGDTLFVVLFPLRVRAGFRTALARPAARPFSFEISSENPSMRDANRLPSTSEERSNPSLAGSMPATLMISRVSSTTFSHDSFPFE